MPLTAAQEKAYNEGWKKVSDAQAQGYHAPRSGNPYESDTDELYYAWEYGFAEAVDHFSEQDRIDAEIEQELADEAEHGRFWWNPAWGQQPADQHVRDFRTLEEQVSA